MDDTPKDYSTAIKYLRKARLRLTGSKYRFFGLCLYSIRSVIFSDPTGLEGYVAYEKSDKDVFENKIYINGDFIEDLAATYKTLNMIDIMLHEFNHILRRHDIRKGDRDSKLWNIACDHIIDSSLKKLDISKPIISWNILKEIEYNNKYSSEESVYNWLKNQNEICINDEQDGSVSVKSKFGSTDFKMYPDLQKDDINPEQSQAIESYVSQIRAIYNIEKDKGNIEGNVKEAFEKLLEVVVPWETLLEKAIKKNAFEKTNRRNWKRPNKFFMGCGLYLPGRVPFIENNGVGTLIIHIDSSGSINSKDLRKAGYILYKSIQYFDKIIVLVADTIIRQEKEFKKNNCDEMLKYFEDSGYLGRGGTSHYHVFRYMDKHLEDNPDSLSLCISITDMFSDIESSLDRCVFHKSIPLILLSTTDIKINNNNILTINII